MSVRFCGFLAGSDDDADCTLLGGGRAAGAPKPPGGRKNVQLRQ